MILVPSVELSIFKVVRNPSAPATFGFDAPCISLFLVLSSFCVSSTTSCGTSTSVCCKSTPPAVSVLPASFREPASAPASGSPPSFSPTGPFPSGPRSCLCTWLSLSCAPVSFPSSSFVPLGSSRSIGALLTVSKFSGASWASTSVLSLPKDSSFGGLLSSGSVNRRNETIQWNIWTKVTTFLKIKFNYNWKKH